MGSGGLAVGGGRGRGLDLSLLLMKRWNPGDTQPVDDGFPDSRVSFMSTWVNVIEKRF